MNNELSCQEMIEVVTNYLDGAIPPVGALEAVGGEGGLVLRCSSPW